MLLRSLPLPAGLLGLCLALAPGAASTALAAAGGDATPATGAPARSPAAARPASGKAAIPPRVSEAWIAEAPPTARHNAAYLQLRNGSRADTLLAVETPVAAVVEMHEMRMEQGVMRMRQEKRIDLPANAELRLAPGGRHLMLIDMKRALRPGERVPLTLRFRRAGAITVQAEVRPLPLDGGEAPLRSEHSGHEGH